MKVRYFVVFSSLVLACWLSVTYVRPVSEKNYPLLGKGSVPATAMLEELPLDEPVSHAKLTMETAAIEIDPGH